MKSLFAVASILLCLTLPVRAAEGDQAPFDNDLQRLAEILGSLQYLRGICGANEGQKWRNEMQSLIDAEVPSGERGKLQSWLPGFSTDLSHLHAGREHRDSTLSRRRH